MEVTHWSYGKADPAAREGACPRCGEPLDDTPAKTTKVDGAWVHRRCLRPGDDHPYAPSPREEAG